MGEQSLTHKQDLSGMRSRISALGYRGVIAVSVVGGVLTAAVLFALGLGPSVAISAGVAMVLACGFVTVITLVEFDDGDINRMSKEAADEGHETE